MLQQKSIGQIKEDFSNVKINFGELHDLMKIFIHEYSNFIEDENYPDNNEYTAKNCLYTIMTTIDKKLETNLKNIEQLYLDFEFLENSAVD